MGESEADACRRYVTPALIRAGWDIHHQIAEQRPVTDGRVVIVGKRATRKQPKRLDYLLRYTRDVPLAVVEAKSTDIAAAAGLQQAIEYALTLEVPFAFATNGLQIIEHDFLTGDERELNEFPSPDELWSRVRAAQNIDDDTLEVLTTPHYIDPARTTRYYQTLAINKTVAAFAQGRERVLLTLATGTGKSYVAFQICWVLWNAYWTRSAGPRRRPRILYLADRNVLVDQPRLGVFAPFGEALHRIGSDPVTSREVYFATYQQIAEDDVRPGLYREYPPDFFDLIIIDECHRGSADADSRWREVLQYFASAAKLGMTATPVHQGSRDTYRYFGAPLMTYTLAQGIDDGFLAPYRVRRVLTDVDALGWRPTRGEVDRYGELIPDTLYVTEQFERVLVLSSRIQAMADYLTRYLKATDPYAKTIVFCVDQEHALLMRNALVRANPGIVADHPDYVVRITSDEGDFGRGHLENFQDIDRLTPVIVTTSEMLTTGVDAPTVKNVVLARWVRSMPTFKQIIGRGTRLRTDYDKWFFTIVDFTGIATRMFADAEFDGYPEASAEESIDEFEPNDDSAEPEDATDEQDDDTRSAYQRLIDAEDQFVPAQKYYVDGMTVAIIADVVYHLGPDGQRLSATTYTQYAGEQIRTVVRSSDELQLGWPEPIFRREMMNELEARGISVADLQDHCDVKGVDPFDLLCFLAFQVAPRTRSSRVDSVRRSEQFMEGYGEGAREVLSAILDQYAEHGPGELEVANVLRIPGLSRFGNVTEIAGRFGGVQQLRDAVTRLQHELYAV